MVHKKYIKRGNKVFGPYLYENYRVNGVTKTRYLGHAPEPPKKKNLRDNLHVLVLMGILVVAFAMIFFYTSFYSGITGRVTSELNPSSSINGGMLNATLDLGLKPGELIPADSVVKVQLGEQEKEVPLSFLISMTPVSGNYYAENSNLTGSGLGYGIPGEKISYPTIYFAILIISADNSIYIQKYGSNLLN